MTGFGKYEVMKNNRKITVEIKSVNHKSSDINIKMPRKFNAYEAEIKNIIKHYASRGKVDVYITYEDFSGDDISFIYNEKIAAEYYELAQKIAKDFNLENDLTVMALMKSPEVITMEEVREDEDILYELTKEAVEGACEQFCDARMAEGTYLYNDLKDKLDNLRMIVNKVSIRSPKVLEEYRCKLENKVKELLEGTDMDYSRIAMEVTIFADKMCVDEEVVRLGSHIDNMLKEIKKDGPVGKNLDFIAQEMNREANTILSKANDLEVTNMGIELKTEIEKIREQVQNIE